VGPRPPWRNPTPTPDAYTTAHFLAKCVLSGLHVPFLKFEGTPRALGEAGGGVGDPTLCRWSCAQIELEMAPLLAALEGLPPPGDPDPEAPGSTASTGSPPASPSNGARRTVNFGATAVHQVPHRTIRTVRRRRPSPLPLSCPRIKNSPEGFEPTAFSISQRFR